MLSSKTQKTEKTGSKGLIIKGNRIIITSMKFETKLVRTRMIQISIMCFEIIIDPLTVTPSQNVSMSLWEHGKI